LKSPSIFGAPLRRGVCTTGPLAVRAKSQWVSTAVAAGAVAVLTDPETGRTRYQPLPMVERDDWGFDIEAPMDGEAYARLPDTRIDTNRKRLAMLASNTDTQHADELARRRKGFQPLAHLDDGRGVDPYREAETTPPVTWLPKRGTEHRVAAPEVAPLLLEVEAAALRLAPLVRARGSAWGPAQYDWLAGRYPQGVPEEALLGIVETLVAEPQPEKPRAAGLRLV
jgi:hypothetical protein